MAQIGTIRLETQNSGTVDVPVFDVGDSGSGVYEFLRVQTASGTGFIPVVDPAEASFPYLRIQSQNQGVVAVHNETALGPLPEDFEDNDISDYNQSGSPTITTNSLEGTYSYGGGGFIWKTSGGPSSGDTFRWLQECTADSFSGVYYAVTDSSVRPGSSGGPALFTTLNPDSANSGISIYDYDSNGNTIDFVENTGIGVSQNVVYEVETVWSGNDLTATVTEQGGAELGSVTYTNTNKTGAGYGFSDNGILDFLRIV